MYLWKTRNLVTELRGKSLSEENFKNYYLATSILTLVGYYLALLEPPTNLVPFSVEAIGSVGVTIFGLNFAFKANGGNSGSHFLNKAISIAFPLLIKVVIAGFILGILSVTFEESGFKIYQIEWFYSLSVILIQVVFFWRLTVHVRDTNA